MGRRISPLVTSGSNSQTNITAPGIKVTLLGFGIKGDRGDDGTDGVDGTGGGGSGGDLTFRHVQAIPSASWEVFHNLGKYPSVMVVDSTGSVVEGDIQYIDENNVTLRFGGGFSGEAHLN